MAEHYCSVHKTVWFMKGKMKNYAHPVLDESGDQTYDENGKAVWCNEPKKEKPPEEGGKDKSEKKSWGEDSPQKRSSIEAQNALTNSIPLARAIADLLPHDEASLKVKRLLDASYNYIVSKLGNWSSMGEVVEQEPVDDALLEEAYKRYAKEKAPDAPEHQNKPLKKETSSKPPEITWEAIYPDVNKLYKNVKGWITTAEIMATLKKLGADDTTGAISKSFNTLNPEGRKKFAEMVEKGLGKTQ